MVTKEQMKEVAIQRMRQLGIYKPYINAFKAKNQKVCEFEKFAGFYIEKGSPLSKKIAEIEEKYNAVVYAVITNHTEFGTAYSLLYVGEEDVLRCPELERLYGSFIAYAYVWTPDDETTSELGTIGIKTCFGGCIRVW